MSDDRNPSDSLKDDLLEHDTRKAIYDAIEQRPGRTEEQLADELDALPIRVEYHVDRLVVCGVLKAVPGERSQDDLLFHASQTDLWANEATRILFEAPPVRRVALYVAEHPGATADRIADAVERTPGAVRAHLQRLQDRELVETREGGSPVQYEPTDALSSWADEVGDGYERPWTGGDEA